MSNVTYSTTISFLGDPLPSVSWFRNNELIDDTDIKTHDDIVKNRIVLSNIQREDLKARYKTIFSFFVSIFANQQQSRLF